jgi:hypothetical protein
MKSRASVKQVGPKKRIEATHCVGIHSQESAAIWSKRLRKRVEVGDTIDLGIAAFFDPNPFKNFWGQLRMKFQRPKVIRG